MKAYYTDPLAAAWMAKYFGMKFDAEIPMRLDAGYINYVQDYSYETLRFYQREVSDRMYIHSESLHLLKPREGDLWIGKETQEQNQLLRCIYITDLGKFSLHMSDMILIQRNGTPFHWPEIED